MSNARDIRVTILVNADERDRIEGWAEKRRSKVKMSMSEAVRVMALVVVGRDIEPTDEEYDGGMKRYARKDDSN